MKNKKIYIIHLISFIFIIISIFLLFFKNRLENNYLNIKVNNLMNNSINWLIYNFKEKGIFIYSFDPLNNKVSTSNNDIRQLLASRIFSELSINNSTFKEIHKKNINFIFKNWYKENLNKDGAYIFLHNKSKIGANALFIRVLIYSPFFENYKNEINKLVNGIYSLQSENGKLEAWYIKPDYKYDEDYLMYFYSGEVILTFLELYEKTLDKKYLDFAIKSENYYYNEYINNIEKNYYPAYVPWHTFSMSKLFKITQDKKYLEAIFLMNNKLLKQQDIDKNSKYFGRFFKEEYKKYGSPHSSSDSIYTESILYAYELAKNNGYKNLEKLYLNSIKYSLYNINKMQYTSNNIFNLNNKYLYLGGIRTNSDNYNIRVDNNAHLIDMILKYKKVSQN